MLKQQAMPVPAVIVPVCTMGMAREGSCRLEQMLPKKGGRNGASSLERWSGREVANCDSCAAEVGGGCGGGWRVGSGAGSMRKRRMMDESKERRGAPVALRRVRGIERCEGG